MVLPLILTTGAIGAFVGSQIDDAVENPSQSNFDGNAKIKTSDIVKIVAIAGVGYLILKNLNIIKGKLV